MAYSGGDSIKLKLGDGESLIVKQLKYGFYK